MPTPPPPPPLDEEEDLFLLSSFPSRFNSVIFRRISSSRVCWAICNAVVVVVVNAAAVVVVTRSGIFATFLDVSEVVVDVGEKA